jgi:hypothetical protein
MNGLTTCQSPFHQVVVVGSFKPSTETDTATAKPLKLAPSCIATHLCEQITDFTTATVLPLECDVYQHREELQIATRADTTVADPRPASRPFRHFLHGCANGAGKALVSQVLFSTPVLVAVFSGLCYVVSALFCEPITLSLSAVLIPWILAVPTVIWIARWSTNWIRSKIKRPTTA